MPASIIFKKTSSHVVNKDKTTRCHYILAYNLMPIDVSNQWRSVNSVSWNHGHKKTSLSHWRWSFHANTNEVPSLTIKMAGISLTNKEEQLSAMPLDNQGGTWVASPMNPNSSTKNQQKSRKVDGRRACNCLFPHLLARGLIQGKVLLNGLWALINR